MKRGEVWRVRLPPAPGHEQAGERPAVLIQDDDITPSLTTVLIVPFTGTLAADRYPGTVLVQPDSQNGLTVPSVALVLQVRALDQRNCVRKLGTLDGQTFDRNLEQLDRSTGR